MKNSIEYQRAWRAKNADKVKKYREKHREVNREKSREWRIKNYEKYRDNIRKWQAVNADKGRLYRAQRRAKTRGIKINLEEIHNWDSRICGICSVLIEGKYHIDHIVPLSRGGEHKTSNLQLAHPYCNQSKFTKLTSELDVVL